jgi:hypothetical protein
MGLKVWETFKSSGILSMASLIAETVSSTSLVKAGEWSSRTSFRNSLTFRSMEFVNASGSIALRSFPLRSNGFGGAKQRKSGFYQELGFNRNEVGKRGLDVQGPKSFLTPIPINSGLRFKSREHLILYSSLNSRFLIF